MTKLINRYSVSAGQRLKHEKTTEIRFPQYMDGGALDCWRHSFYGKVSITQREEGGDHVKSDSWKVTYDTCFFVGE